MSARKVSQLLGDHYARKFAEYGLSPQGVDWGPDPKDHQLRLERMLAVTELGRKKSETQSILDVGCGYGSLLELIRKRDASLAYIGIDLCEPMIAAARSMYPEASWLNGDILDLNDREQYDYVVCNGVLTQKLGATISEMDDYLRALVTCMFNLCRIGIAFNVMTTHVNFMAPNLYYRNPIELLAWCMTQLSSRARMDHAYPMFEYTIYLYRDDAPGLAYGANRAASRQ
jgi:SAM-dependent methyltransferase